jgi:hypothetical protein
MNEKENEEHFKQLMHLGRLAYETGIEEGMAATKDGSMITPPTWNELENTTQDFWMNIACSVANEVADIMRKDYEKMVFKKITDRLKE